MWSQVNRLPRSLSQKRANCRPGLREEPCGPMWPRQRSATWMNTHPTLTTSIPSPALSSRATTLPPPHTHIHNRLFTHTDTLFINQKWWGERIIAMPWYLDQTGRGGGSWGSQIYFLIKNDLWRWCMSSWAMPCYVSQLYRAATQNICPFSLAASSSPHFPNSISTG